MPYLYCATHGPAHVNRIIAEQDAYHEAGESVLVVSGTLRQRPVAVRQMQRRPPQGDPATLPLHLPPAGH